MFSFSLCLIYIVNGNTRECFQIIVIFFCMAVLVLIKNRPKKKKNYDLKKKKKNYDLNVFSSKSTVLTGRSKQKNHLVL